MQVASIVPETTVLQDLVQGLKAFDFLSLRFQHWSIPVNDHKQSDGLWILRGRIHKHLKVEQQWQVPDVKRSITGAIR